MSLSIARSFRTPRDAGLGLHRIENRAGLSISILPNGALFAIEDRREGAAIMVNQLLGSPIGGAVARLYLRVRGEKPACIEAVGPGAKARFAAGADCFTWVGETGGLRHCATLSLQPQEAAWIWRLEVQNLNAFNLEFDAILVQDIGLGERGFLMNNEAYASQYIDCHVAQHGRYGPLVMSRQNLAQNGRNPWAVHGCLDRARAFATDAMQVFGPTFRDRTAPLFADGADLPAARLQHEFALVAIQSEPVAIAAGAGAACRFFGLYDPDHAEASRDADCARVDAIAWRESPPLATVAAAPVRSLLDDAPVATASPLGADELAELYPERLLEERQEDGPLSGALLSFFTPDPPHNRHVALIDKERRVTRRHGALLRTGQSMLPDEATMCATFWMHGVFAAQLTIGNTSLHKLFSVSRDPYNITRASGLRILIDLDEGWRLLAIPSAFEIGLSDARWIYRLGARRVTVRAIASGEDAAIEWRVAIEGAPAPLLVFAHIVLGEREYEQEALVEVDLRSKRFGFRPDPHSLWGRTYPQAVYHLVCSTPDAVQSIGGDELLYADEKPRGAAHIALRAQPTRELRFAVVGSLDDPQAAEQLAVKYSRGVEDLALLAPAAQYWRRVTRGLRIEGEGAAALALDLYTPWLAHDAMIHLTVPHGLEQYTGAAWGVRDVCQGPVECLLAFEHDETVKQILQRVFAQQYESQGDWPQWFMLEPYSAIQDQTSHGDVIIWPLKALNDYIEATGDFAFLDDPIPWRRQDTFERTAHRASVAEHIDKLLATIRARFIPGTRLIRYGEGDWNDSLQPADPKMCDWMTSSWTVALLFQQLNRYALILRRAGRAAEAEPLSALAAAMRDDVNRHLIRDGVIAGYVVFSPDGGDPELLIHPRDERTGLSYSLLPMTRSIIAGLFTPDQAQHHLRLIRDHLLFPDGARLLDRPVTYRGGPQLIFRRAESSSFFGREIGLMYVHAHLRYAEAMAALGETEAMFEALSLVNPIGLPGRLAQARLRQSNAYFSSSDAAFPDRYAASAQWEIVKAGEIGVDGGWRVYSSGPGLFANLLIRHVLGRRRSLGARIAEASSFGLTPRWDLESS